MTSDLARSRVLRVPRVEAVLGSDAECFVHAELRIASALKIWYGVSFQPYKISFASVGRSEAGARFAWLSELWSFRLRLHKKSALQA